jgi:hypothetical protein
MISVLIQFIYKNYQQFKKHSHYHKRKRYFFTFSVLLYSCSSHDYMVPPSSYTKHKMVNLTFGDSVHSAFTVHTTPRLDSAPRISPHG